MTDDEPPRVASALVTGLASVAPAGERDEPRLVAVDHYVLGEVIAEGGMGRIRRARDRRLGRDVAIKEVRDPSSELAARLEREARLTARLHHPSIVTVHEAGLGPSGEPFFAMEIVSGRPLDQAIADAPTLAARLALLPHAIAAADAIAYAHSCGIIHRDLKPGNVMVGAFGETVVIDWGLAKDIAAADPPTRDHRAAPGATAYGALIGTPEYMAPEQARGEPADERVDVYALGALLFHLLAGEPPFRADDREAVLDRVLGAAPAPLAPDTPRDLVAIVRKAMARDRAARYPSARELAEDLRRFQTGQLVAARRYSTGERLRRFVARHRVLVGTVGGAALVVAAVAAFGLRQRALAEDRRARVERVRGISEELVGTMLTRLEPQLARLGRLDAMRGIASEVDDYYRQLAAVGEALDAGARDRRIAALRTLGDVFDDYGDLAKATAAYRAALALGGGALEAARARTGLARQLDQAGQPAAALAELERADAALAALTGPGVELARAVVAHRTGAIRLRTGAADRGLADLAAALAHATGDDRAARAERAQILDRRADALVVRIQLPAALADARAGLALREQLAADDPGDVEHQLGLAGSYDRLARIAIRNADPAAARAAAIRQAELAAKIVERDPDNARWQRVLMSAYQRRSEAEEAAERYPDAVTSGRQAAAIAERLVARDPSNADRRWDLLQIRSKLASHLQYAHRGAEALAILGEEVPAAEALARQVPTNVEYQRWVGVLHEYTGDVLAGAGRWAEAADAYRARLAIDRRLAAAHPELTAYQMTVPVTLFLVGDALVNLPAQRAEGFAIMEDALAQLRVLRDAGKLSKEGVEGIGLREEELASQRKAHRQ
jgi:tetratricopeptide (TPR) repeat protein